MGNVCCGWSRRVGEQNDRVHSRSIKIRVSSPAGSRLDVPPGVLSRPRDLILILGQDRAGKTTVFRQAVLQFGNKFDHVDRRVLLRELRAWVVEVVRARARRAWRLQSPRVLDDDLNRQVQFLMSYVAGDADDDIMSMAFVSAVDSIWADTRIRQWSESGPNGESEWIFISKVARIADPDYVVTDDDIVHAQIPSLDIQEADLNCDSCGIRAVDVNQRSSHLKWLTMMDRDRRFVFFVCAVHEYDRIGCGAPSGLESSLSMFRDVCMARTMAHVPVVLLLNKVDLLEDKLRREPYADYDPTFHDSNETVPVVMHIQKRFLAISREAQVATKMFRAVHVQMVTATRTGNVQFAIREAIRQVVLPATTRTIEFSVM
ncbi:unnamed protein product (mitochondrion) [Plasmodiophora brassicae]|uniref:Uncharacterized protein n=1 Tax=Plasmodiophora brassicae TaxID=37360 RepID=A0A0G4J5Z1_PLABS|nr:hypothetical protein PBRA_002638 [Plasmodiophora brassicae]SPQ94798.1 unnamed protein product [Plasmodiophora brassicae]